MMDGYSFNGAKGYKDSKLALMMLSNMLHDKYHRQTGIAFSSIYPGYLFPRTCALAALHADLMLLRVVFLELNCCCAGALPSRRCSVRSVRGSASISLSS